MRRLGVLVLSGLLAVSCGGDESALERADDELARARSGRLDLSLTAAGGGSEEVGFRVVGPFSYEADDEAELAVLDLRATSIQGERTVERRVVSDGRRAVVVAGGETVPVPRSAAASLRLGDGDGDGDGGLGDLGIAGWVRDGQETERDGRTVIRGEVDVADLLSDIARVAAQVAGDDDLPRPSGEAAERLQALVRDSEIHIELEDDQLRSLVATVDLGPDDGELGRALGRYAAARLTVRLTYEPLDEPLEVELPG